MMRMITVRMVGERNAAVLSTKTAAGGTSDSVLFGSSAALLLEKDPERCVALLVKNRALSEVYVIVKGGAKGRLPGPASCSCVPWARSPIAQPLRADDRVVSGRLSPVRSYGSLPAPRRKPGRSRGVHALNGTVVRPILP